MKIYKAEHLKVGMWVMLKDGHYDDDGRCIRRSGFYKIEKIGALGEQRWNNRQEKEANRVPVRLEGIDYAYYFLNEPSKYKRCEEWLAASEAEMNMIKLKA